MAAPKPSTTNVHTVADDIDDDEIEEDIASISEHISFDDSNRTESDAGAVGGSGSGAANKLSATKKRQLFAFDDDGDDDDITDMEPPMFGLDDAQLDGDRIAEHFRVADEHNTDNDRKSADNSPARASSVASKALPHKEVSPFNEDVILLNNDKITLASLKQQHKQLATLPPLQLPPLQLKPAFLQRDVAQPPPPHSSPLPLPKSQPLPEETASSGGQNTTNDVSDLAPDVDDRTADDVDDVIDVGAEHHSDDQHSADHQEERCFEADQSVDEIIISDASICVDLVPKTTVMPQQKPAVGVAAAIESQPNDTLDDISLGSVDSEPNVSPQINRHLADAAGDDVDYDAGLNTSHDDGLDVDSLDNVSDGVLELRQRIADAPDVIITRSGEQVESGEEVIVSDDGAEASATDIKPMQRIETSNKEALEDISEVTEPSAAQPMQPNATQANETFDSVVSLNMLEAFESRIRELDAETSPKMSVDPNVNSLATISTEYRPYADEFNPLAGRAEQMHQVLAEREHLIEQLTDALQQSMQSRDQLQQRSDRMAAELAEMRAQLSGDAADVVRRPSAWMLRAGGGQRISEISIDLVSEGDVDDQGQQQQLGEDIVAVTMATSSAMSATSVAPTDQLVAMGFPRPTDVLLGASSTMDDFQRCLSVDERAVFASMRDKFEDWMLAGMERVRARCEEEMRIVSDSSAAGKAMRESEVSRMIKT